MKTYIPNIVGEIRNWYGPVLYEYDSKTSLKQFFGILSDRLWKAYQSNCPIICNQINNYHPNFIGFTWDKIRKAGFTKKDAVDTIAFEHSFKGMMQVPELYMDIDFESSVNALLTGDLNEVQKSFLNNPSLIHRRSQYGHGATLLHYLGNNGVELYRQIIPDNTIEVIQTLVKYGADINATMKVYGGHFTMIELFNTSIHPIEAGIKEEFSDAYRKLMN